MPTFQLKQTCKNLGLSEMKKTDTIKKPKLDCSGAVWSGYVVHEYNSAVVWRKPLCIRKGDV